MKTGGWRVWAALAVCAAMMLGAMTWLTRHVIGAERERAAAEARADLQERMRLALWRMDAAGTAIIVEESQRPVMPDGAVPSEPAGWIKMRFELSEHGGLSSPQGEARLPELRRLLRESGEGRALFPALSRSLDASRETWEANQVEPLPPQDAAKDADQAQSYSSEKERAVRGKAVASQVMKVQEASNTFSAGAPSKSEGPAFARPAERVLREAGPPQPVWIGSELFLLRRIRWQGGGESIQGAWLEAEALKRVLLAEARDLLPAAALVPATPDASADGMVLASFPWRLETGERPSPAAIPRPIIVSLAVGWIAALLAVFAVAVLVRGILRLSERRASFVSAVTHELRTPLTTFRLYSEMLEAGAVKEEKRGDYLRVLSREADRLSHLVENVLAFSRIERGSARAVVRETTARELLEPMRERFAGRLASAGLELDLDLAGEAAARPLKVDAAAVEHVLFNLIDNAAKYAVPGDPPKVALGVEYRPGGIAIVVRDFGPGIAPGERKRIFRAFHKSAREAAESRPGVGLGLALSRRLARGMGGELVFEAPAAGRGACFILRVPLGT
jgi:signal transduction histidine kinase